MSTGQPSVGFGLLQDEYALTGEFQIFDGWARRAEGAGLSVRRFSPAGQRLRTQSYCRHETGESLLRTFREQWLFIRQALETARSVDMLHLFLPTSNFFWISDRIKRRAAKPVVVTCLGEKAETLPVSGLGGLGGAWRFHLVRHLASRLLCEGRFCCDRYVAGTQVVARQLRRSGCAEAAITVQTPLLAPEAAPEPASLDAARGFDPDRTFLYLGHFLPSKGVDILLRAFAALEDPASRLVLAWSGLGDAPGVRRRIDQLGLARRTSILDFPVHRSTLFSRCRALVLPCPFSYGQTSPPMAILEAFRAGVPVLTSRFPHLAAFGEDGQTLHFAEAGDWRDLARKMRSLLEHPEAAEPMRRRQRTRFQELGGSFDLRRFYEGVLRHDG